LYACLSDATTYRRLRSYRSLSGRVVPPLQAALGSSSYSKRCSLRHSHYAASDDYREDFGHASGVAVGNRSAGHSPAGCIRWAIRSTCLAVLAAAAG
jgi:hypothetical protein